MWKRFWQEVSRPYPERAADAREQAIDWQVQHGWRKICPECGNAYVVSLRKCDVCEWQDGKPRKTSLVKTYKGNKGQDQLANDLRYLTVAGWDLTQMSLDGARQDITGITSIGPIGFISARRRPQLIICVFTRPAEA